MNVDNIYYKIMRKNVTNIPYKVQSKEENKIERFERELNSIRFLRHQHELQKFSSYFEKYACMRCLRNLLRQFYDLCWFNIQLKSSLSSDDLMDPRIFESTMTAFVCGRVRWNIVSRQILLFSCYVIHIYN